MCENISAFYVCFIIIHSLHVAIYIGCPQKNFLRNFKKELMKQMNGPLIFAKLLFFIYFYILTNCFSS